MGKITIKVKKLSGWEKFIGLMGNNKPEAVYFETRWGIHTFGVKSPIDVLILDDNNRIVKIKKNLKPNRVFFWSPMFYKVLEIPANTNVKLNTIISLSEE